MAPHANLCMPLAFLDVKAINAGRSVRLKSTTKIMICQKLILKELIEQLNPNIILVGLNFSRKDLGKELKDWNNFHSS